MTTSNIANYPFSPRGNELNQENLNYLNEEASQFLEDYLISIPKSKSLSFKNLSKSDNQEKDEDEYFNNNRNMDLNYSQSKSEKIKEKSKAYINIENDYNYDDTYSEEQKEIDLHKEYINKLDKINVLNSQIQNKDVLIKTLKQTISRLQEKLSANEKIKSQIDLHTKEFKESKNQVYILRAESMKLQEMLIKKDNIISEFHKLSDLSKNKFKIFEEKNLQLMNEVENLNTIIANVNSKNEELKDIISEKERIIEELKLSRMDYDNQLKENNFQMLKKEDKIRLKYEDKENKLRQKHKEKEQLFNEEYISEIKSLANKIEEIKLDNDKLVYENFDLKDLIDNFETKYHEREREFRRELDQKADENAKLQRNVNEIHNEIQELEKIAEEKEKELNLKLRNKEHSEREFILLLAQKDKTIRESEEKLNNLNNALLDLETKERENILILENKETIIEQCRCKNDLLLEELRTLEQDYKNAQQTTSADLELASKQISELTKQKDCLIRENAEIRNSLVKATDKINELNELIEVEYQGLENQLLKEKALKENLERNLRELRRKYTINHEKLKSDNAQLRNLLEKKTIEYDNIITKYETKINKLKLKLEMREDSNDQIISDLSTMNDWAAQMERKNKHEQNLNFSLNNTMRSFNLINSMSLNTMDNSFFDNRKRLESSLNASQSNVETQKKVLDNFIDNIEKIDNKIYGSYPITIENTFHSKKFL